MKNNISQRQLEDMNDHIKFVIGYATKLLGSLDEMNNVHSYYDRVLIQNDIIGHYENLSCCVRAIEEVYGEEY